MGEQLQRQIRQRAPLTMPDMTPQATTRMMFSSQRVRFPTARSAMGKRNGSAFNDDVVATTVFEHRRPTSMRMASEE